MVPQVIDINLAHRDAAVYQMKDVFCSTFYCQIADRTSPFLLCLYSSHKIHLGDCLTNLVTLVMAVTCLNPAARVGL